MTITIPDLTVVPIGCWVALAVLVWYTAAALIIKYKIPFGWCFKCLDEPERFGLWLFSPVGLPLLGLSLVANRFIRYALVTKKDREKLL